jgi:hypothetical protein
MPAAFKAVPACHQTSHKLPATIADAHTICKHCTQLGQWQYQAPKTSARMALQSTKQLLLQMRVLCLVSCDVAFDGLPTHSAVPYQLHCHAATTAS